MSMSKIFSACLVAVDFSAVTGSPVAAQPIENGDFETNTAGAFDSWISTPASGVASTPTAPTAPTVIGGNRSARLLSRGGILSQTVSIDGIHHFSIEMDFAVLDTASTDVRSFGIVTYSKTDDTHGGSDNVDSIRVYTTTANRQEIQIYDDGGFQNIGLFFKATPDIRGDLRFDDGEIPVTNHLRIVDTGYGAGE